MVDVAAVCRVASSDLSHASERISPGRHPGAVTREQRPNEPGHAPAATAEHPAERRAERQVEHPGVTEEHRPAAKPGHPPVQQAERPPERRAATSEHHATPPAAHEPRPPQQAMRPAPGPENHPARPAAHPEPRQAPHPVPAAGSLKKKSIRNRASLERGDRGSRDRRSPLFFAPEKCLVRQSRASISGGTRWRPTV